MTSNRTQFITSQLTADLYSKFVRPLIRKSILVLLPSKNVPLPSWQGNVAQHNSIKSAFTKTQCDLEGVNISRATESIQSSTGPFKDFEA